MIEIANIKTFNLDNTIQGQYGNILVKSKWCYPDTDISIDECDTCTYKEYCDGEVAYVIDHNELEHVQDLIESGDTIILNTILVSMSITAPMYWWQSLNQNNNKDIIHSNEYPLYELHNKPFDISDFSTDAMNDIGISALQQYINSLESFRQIYINGFGKYEKYDPTILNTMLQMLPASYNLYGTLVINYETLRYIYQHYNNSLMPEWKSFCNIIEELPYAKELICI